jgi:hypothetical protein
MYASVNIFSFMFCEIFLHMSSDGHNAYTCVFVFMVCSSDVGNYVEFGMLQVIEL